MKRELEDDNISENNEIKYKIYKPNEIILIDESFNIKYHIESKREIFIRHFAEMKCPFCQKEITQFINIGYDKEPELIEFCPENLINHIRNIHNDKCIAIKKSSINLNKQQCEINITKKVVL